MHRTPETEDSQLSNKAHAVFASFVAPYCHAESSAAFDPSFREQENERSRRTEPGADP